MTSPSESDKPSQGDVWLTALGAGRVGEPAKTRPTVVVSADWLPADSVYDLLFVVPLSSSLPPATLRPRLLPTPSTGLQKPSVAIPRAMRGVSRTRLLKRLGRVDDDTMDEIGHVLAALLGLPL